MLLADAFPDAHREDFLKRNIDLGSALLIKIPSFNINYEKYAIYIANDSLDSSNCGLVIINTEINENVNRSKYLQSQHVTIDVERHHFLEYDSFVDCTQIHSHKIEEIVNYIRNNADHLCGNVQADVLAEIHEKICASNVISKKVKLKYSFITAE